jgi:6-phosphogluconolactonase
MEQVLEFPSAELLVTALTERIRELLQHAVARRGQASLAVSGGTTPIPLFVRLAEMDLPWDKVTISLVDERWVEPQDPSSNENLVRTYLLRHQAAAARFIPMKTEDHTAVQGEETCALWQQQISRPYDCLLLGMGHDGHTASLFPGASNLEAAVDLDSGKICLPSRPPAAPYERMTLTLPAILASRQIFLPLQGEAKKQIVARALQAGDAKEMPIRFILRQQSTPVTIYWSP